MKKTLSVICCTLLIAGLATAAHAEHGHGGGRGVDALGWFVLGGIAGSALYPYASPVYAYHYPYPYYYPYQPPIVYQQAAPPTVIYEQAPAPAYPAPSYAPPTQTAVAPPSQTQPGQVWYYCDKPNGFYPYVSRCPKGWRVVPTTPMDVPPR